MRIIFIALSSIALFLLAASSVNAMYAPSSVPNNRFGIHILDESDFEKAATLVNSNGGDWGYVTLVIREDEMNQAVMQKKFDRLRELRLIPIVRIATSMTKTSWKKPTADDASKWADFLNSLNWVIENRYVVLFNEPNHDKEWGGLSSAAEYAEVAKAFRDKLKEKSQDFFILPAGMDVAANNSGDTTDAYIFWERMAEAEPDIFKQFDGWNSHSYPNPGFSGEVSDTSRQSIKSYKKEIEFLTKFGLRQNIPVFITETGWVHNSQSRDQIADNFVKAYESVWNENQVVAVTPFVLNYLRPPFDHFSWIAPDGKFYPQYEKIKDMKKTRGEPKQKVSIEWAESPIPEELFVDSDYTLVARVKNTGQSIWNGDDYELVVSSTASPGTYIKGHVPRTLPNQVAEIEYNLKTQSVIQTNTLIVSFLAFSETIGNPQNGEVTLIPPATLELHAQTGLKRAVNARDFKLVIYEGIRLIKEIDNLEFTNGVGFVREIRDLIPGKSYRFVLIKPQYLPVQAYQILDENQTTVSFPILMPVDINRDGAFTPKDLVSALLHPLDVMALWWPF